MPEPLRPYRIYILMFLLNVAVLVGLIYILRRPESRVITITTPLPLSTPTTVLIQVQVSGAVIQPGVYKLPSGSHLSEALENAGGARPDADLTALNLARKLSDGEEIRVPAGPTAGNLETAIPTKATSLSASPTRRPASTRGSLTNKININTATSEQLNSLPRIGPVLAQRIIDYRSQNGAFTTIEEIKKVKGIGETVFKDLEDLITAE